MSGARSQVAIRPSEPASATRQLAPIARFRPAELYRLIRRRHGRVLPADDIGRRAAHRMLDAYALAGPEALDAAKNFLRLWCPWMTRADRDAAAEDAFRFPRHWSPGDLGDDLGLTWEERDAERITTIRPAGGVTEAELKARSNAKAADRKREQRRQMTLHAKPTQKPLLCRRAEAIANHLRFNERCLVANLCRDLKRAKTHGFITLEAAAMRIAVHRAIDLGVKEGFLRKEIEPGIPHGRAWVTKVGSPS